MIPADSNEPTHLRRQLRVTNWSSGALDWKQSAIKSGTAYLLTLPLQSLLIFKKTLEDAFTSTVIYLTCTL